MNTRQAGPDPAAKHEPQAIHHPAQAKGRKDKAAQGAKLPSAPRPPQAAPSQDLRIAAHATMTAPDPMADPRAFWAAVAGIAPEHLVFAPGPSPLLHRWTRWLETHPRTGAFAARTLRLWRILWFGPRHPDPACLPRTPLNLAPWTNRLLPDPRVTPGGSRLSRFGHYLLWHLSHPHTRYETHAWRCKARARLQPAWRLRCLRNTLAGQPSGPPPWIDAPPKVAAVSPGISIETSNGQPA